MEFNIWEILTPILATALTTILSYVGLRLKGIYEEHINTKEKQAVVKHTVKYVEQVFGELEGCEKLQKAKTTATEWLNQKGINISEAELTVLIESAVQALKGGFYANTIDVNELEEDEED